MEKKDVLGTAIDKLFSIPKEYIFLAVIFAIGFILRLIAAINLSVSADDMHHVIHAINFFFAGRLETYDQSSGLWHSFTSIIYNIMGTTQLSSRMAALIFGSLSIPLMYLLSKEFFDRKIALIAAFLLAVAPFHIKNTMGEMDVMAMFFVLFAFFIFIMALKNGKKKFFFLSGIFMGLAIYTKVYPLLFVPSLLLYFIYYKKKTGEKIITKRNAGLLSIFLIGVFIFTVPTLTHNYLLYKDKGFMDLQFTRTLGIGKNVSEQYYGWDAQFNSKNSWAGLIFGDKNHIANGTPLLLGATNFVFKGDPLNFILGVFGLLLIIFAKKEKKDYAVLFGFGIMFVFPFLASSILLPKHYLFLVIFLVPMAAFSVLTIVQKIGNRPNYIKASLGIILLFTLIFLGIPNSADITHFYGTSNTAQMINFKEDNVGKNDLVVADNRMYAGRIDWAFNGRHYLEAVDFFNLLQNQNSIQGKSRNVTVYFFECVSDDCGWGTIRNQPELNATMEQIVDIFAENGKLEKTIKEPDEAKVYYPFFGKKVEATKIYSVQIELKEQIMTQASKPKEWFLYTIGYIPKEAQFDYYSKGNAFDLLLDSLAHKIVALALVLAFLSPIFLIYFLFKESKAE